MAAKRLKWSFRGMDARGTGVEYVRAGEYDAACVECKQARMEAAEWRRKHDALEQQLRADADKVGSKTETLRRGKIITKESPDGQ